MSHGSSHPDEPEERMTPGVFRRAMRSLSFFLLLLALIMFVPAGVGWTKGWIFLSAFLIETAVSVVYLWRRNPAIFAARSKIQKGIKRWDKLLMACLFASLLAVFPVAGLDDGRFHWSSVPIWLVVLGYVLFSIGFVVSAWAEAVNKFAELGVRIQTDRGHKVVDTGPYAVVRHPMYLAAVLLFFGTAPGVGLVLGLDPGGLRSPDHRRANRLRGPDPPERTGRLQGVRRSGSLQVGPLGVVRKSGGWNGRATFRW